MRIGGRVAALERRASPTGECACSPRIDLFCRDPSKPVPPIPTCARCLRPRQRLLIRRPDPIPGEPPVPVDPNLPAYQEIDADGIRALICGEEPGLPGEVP